MTNFFFTLVLFFSKIIKLFDFVNKWNSALVALIVVTLFENWRQVKTPIAQKNSVKMSNMANMEELELKLRESEKNRSDMEAKLVQSAHFGKQLLDQLKESERIREELEQERHSLKLNLQTVKESERIFQEEIQG